MRRSSLMAVEDCSSVGCSLQWQLPVLLLLQLPVLPAPPSDPWPTPRPGIRGPADLSHQKNIYLEHGRASKNLLNKKELPVKGVSIDAPFCSGKHRGIWQWNWVAEQLPGCSSTSDHLGGNYCATYMKAVMVGERRGLRVTG